VAIQVPDLDIFAVSWQINGPSESVALRELPKLLPGRTASGSCHNRKRRNTEHQAVRAFWDTETAGTKGTKYRNSYAQREPTEMRHRRSGRPCARGREQLQ
jgi:hypothetical protein